MRVVAINRSVNIYSYVQPSTSAETGETVSQKIFDELPNEIGRNGNAI